LIKPSSLVAYKRWLRVAGKMKYVFNGLYAFISGD
jgi:hypothetical protein